MDQSTNRGPARPAGTDEARFRLQDIPGNSVLFDRPQEGVRLDQRLRAVAEVDRAILQGGPNDEVLRLVALRALHLVGAAVTMILLPEKSGELTVLAAEGRNTGQLRGRRLPAQGTQARAVALSSDGHIVPDLSADPTSRPEEAVTGQLGPALFVPLTVRGHVVGILEAANYHGGPQFDDLDLETVQRFTGQVGLAVETHLSEGVELLDALSLEARNERTREQVQRLAPAAVEKEDLLRQTLDRLAQTAVELTGAVACSVQLLEPDRSLEEEGGFGLPETLVTAMERAHQLGAPSPVLEAIASRSAVVVTNERDRILADVRYQPAHELVRQAGWAAVGCLPLASQTGSRGALCYYFLPERRPSESDLGFLKDLAAQAAAVVDNAQLLAAAKRKVALEERRHLARELHDSVSQALYGIVLGARTTLERLDLDDPSRAREPVSYVLQLAEAGLAEMRALIFELLPDSLATEGLAVALVKQANAVRARNGIAVDTFVGGVPESAIESHQAIYRIAQEALQNAAKHAAAHRVELRLRSDDESLRLDVVDDGTGFDAEAAFPGHLGLRSMRERATTLGGTFQISSRPGKGTHVSASVPRFPRKGHAHG